MSNLNGTLILESYDISDIKKDMVQVFDADYNGLNGNEYWKLCDEAQKDGEIITIAEKLGYETEADRFIDEIYNDEENDDVTNIELILGKVKECLGDQASQFQYSITPVNYSDDEYVVTVAYII